MADAATLLNGILAGNRRDISRAITMIESTHPEHRLHADALLQALLPHAGSALRLAVSGVPGAGKSTFIESLGLMLLDSGSKVAVLSIDPSSSVTGGSILADKTRMVRLAASEGAFIRPSPSSGTLGGVAASTFEAMLVCEAAGFDVVIVETVGVGQSEAAAASITDVFVLLQLANTGDDLQAMKRGVLELADVVAVNKSDLDAVGAKVAAAHLGGGKQQSVSCISALTGDGLRELWSDVLTIHAHRISTGELEARRQRNARQWMLEMVHIELEKRLLADPSLSGRLESLLLAVRESRITPRAAAVGLVDAFTRNLAPKE